MFLLKLIYIFIYALAIFFLKGKTRVRLYKYKLSAKSDYPVAFTLAIARLSLREKKYI